MREYGYEVEVVVPPLAEPGQFTEEVSAAQQAEALSYFKARSVAAVRKTGWVIAGDTVVAVDDRVFGKPLDRADAKRILQALAGTTHHVITGVTLLDAESAARCIEHDSTAVTMRALTDAEIDAYLDTGAWEGKAGAYGIQDRGDAFVERIEGSFTNVMGFPMELVASMLNRWSRPHEAITTPPPGLKRRGDACGLPTIPEA